MAADAKSPAATTLDDIPDKLLHLILSCLMASPLCLARAAVTCERWRRIIGHHSFFSSVINDGSKSRYTHPVAGNYHSVPSRRPNNGHDIIFVPSSPPTVRADNRRFSLDFLPGGIRPWEIVDSRCSFLLLARRKKSGWMRRCFPDLLVCQPATRRYQLIPRMEEVKRHRCLGVFLGCCESDIVYKRNGRFAEWGVVGGMSTFSVICVVYEELVGIADGVGTLRTCRFSGGKWYTNKKKKSVMTYGAHVVHLHGPESLRFLGRTYYYPFWSIDGDNKRLLTTVDVRWLPDGFQGTVLRVYGDRRSVRMACLQGSSLQIFVASAFRPNDWALERGLELTEATRTLAGHKEEYFDGSPLRCVKADGEGLVVLAPAAAGTWRFAVDLGSMEAAEWNHGIRDHASLRAYPCELPWPPVMHTCIRRCTRYGRGRCSHTCIC